MKHRPILGTFALSLVLVLVAGLGAAAQRSRDNGWELLGRQQVDFKRDRDIIDVGRSEGKFKQIEIRVDGAPVEIEGMVVTFGNGEKFKPDIRHRFDEGAKTRAIDLPGDRRTIKQIAFNYRSVNRREGKAIVSVYGR